MTPWTLPASEILFAEGLRRLKEKGVALFAHDPAAPPGLEEELRARLRASSRDVERVDPGHGAPVEELAKALHGPPGLSELAASASLERTTALIDGGRIVDARRAQAWSAFLKRFSVERARLGGGLALAVVSATPAVAPHGPEELPRWSRNLRRSDCMIWADQPLPDDRDGLAASLAANLAVELCGWRFDLAKELVRAEARHLADPLAWLKGRPEKPEPRALPLNGSEFPCPLHLLGQDVEELRRRLWRAHLSTLFPMLEDERIALVRSHRKLLRVDDRMREQGVEGVEGIELGPLRWQLQQRLDPRERQSLDPRLDRMVSVRNHLAHRRPAQAEDVAFLLRLRDKAS